MDSFNEKITALLEDMRAALQGHGGDLELVAIEGKTVQLRLRGACGTCPHAIATLKDYIEATLREQIDPEIVVERAL